MCAVINPDRIAWARKRSGFTKVALAGLVDVDVRSVTAWETGASEPSAASETKLCSVLGVTESFLRIPYTNAPSADEVSFRAISKLSSRQRDMALANATIAFDLDDWITSHYDMATPSLPDLRDMPPEDAAFALRQEWSLGVLPCPNIVHLLEAHGIRVFSLAIETKDVDAFCTWKDSVPFVFLNTFKSSARRRFDAAHELGHLVLHRHGEYEGRVTEKEADRFAAAFLMPPQGFNSSISGVPTLHAILQEKKRWGVSVAAFIYQMHTLSIISDWQYRSLFKTISQKGWRSEEPNDLAPEVSAIAAVVLDDLRKSAKGLSGLAAELGVSRQHLNDLFFGLAVTSIQGSENVWGFPTGELRLVGD